MKEIYDMKTQPWNQEQRPPKLLPRIYSFNQYAMRKRKSKYIFYVFYWNTNFDWKTTLDSPKNAFVK